MEISARLEWYGDKVTQEIDRRAARGIGAAAKFLASRIEIAASVQAPTETYITKTGKVRKRATTRAVSGAPPRVVSGNLKRSIGWELVVQRMAIARVGLFSGQVTLDLDPGEIPPWAYGGVHETGDHPFIRIMLDKHRSDLEKIMAGEVIIGRS